MNSEKNFNENEKKSSNFIRNIIDEDLKKGKNNGRVHTRFPPEPNGYLHIGHSKAILINYGIAKDYNGKFNLRFDDTNPVMEDVEYVEAIKKDLKWLGADWEDRMFYSSDYFDKLYNYAVQLIKIGKAYVCDLSLEKMREMRGTLTKSGENSPFRNRSIEENLLLFEEMKNGKFGDGEKVLRAKIDMAAPNLKMRDPVVYRIKHATHHNTGDKWCIYPMYDFTHCLSDSIEKITHSLCSLEFEDNRRLYDWFLDVLNVENHPQQIEFARLNMTYTMMSKRKLLNLVQEKIVTGWDDPRMPTISGLRRRGFTPDAIKDFAERIGVSKADSVVDYALLEHCIREDLNKTATRVMVVMNPVKMIITNYPNEQTEWLDAENNPENADAGKRKIPFCKELYLEREDFLEEAPKKWFRLSIGKEVRLKHAYYVTCTDVVKDEKGEVTEIHCTYDPKTKGGWLKNGRKVKGTLHWVSARHCKDIKVNLYDKLFNKENPEEIEEGKSILDNVNNNSLIEATAKAEPSLMDAKKEDKFQFLRIGYFCADNKQSTEMNPIFNRTVSLKDSWTKINKK